MNVALCGWKYARSVIASESVLTRREQKRWLGSKLEILLKQKRFDANFKEAAVAGFNFEVKKLL